MNSIKSRILLNDTGLIYVLFSIHKSDPKESRANFFINPLIKGKTIDAF